MTEPITEKVLEQITKQIESRKGVFAGSSNDDGESFKSTEARKKSADFLKAMAQKSLSSGGSTSGAETVPTFLSNQFIGIAQVFGLVRRRARAWPMEGMKVDIPTLGTVSSFRLASDGAKIPASTPTTGTVSLRSQTTGVIVPISQKLLRNASIQLVDAISYLIGRSQAKLEDQWGLLGLASGEGLFQTSGVPALTLATGNITYNKITAEDLLSLIDLVDQDFFTTGNMSWVMSLSLLNVFRKLRSVVGTDKQGFLFEDFGGRLPNSMWDVPYELSSVMPKTADGSQTDKKFLGLINWDEVLFGQEKDFTMEVSQQATITDTDGSTLINLFEQNMVALKVSGDIDIKFSNPTKAHAVAKTAAS